MTQFAMMLGMLLAPLLLPPPSHTMTVLDHLQAHHKVKLGWVCYSNKDILCIDDVCGDESGYWKLSVNGNEDVNAYSTVRPDDIVRWEYVKRD